MNQVACAVLAASMASTAFAADKTPNVREGQWETTIRIEMPGMPMALPPFTTSSCITKKDLVPQTQQPGQDCKLLSQKISAESVEWKAQCKDQSGTVMEGSGKIVYKGDTYTGEMTMSTPGGGQPGMQMKYVLSGKRTGDCKKAAAVKP